VDREGMNKLTDSIIGAAMQVHSALGPGLLESAYEACLAYELVERGFKIEQQKPLPVVYKGVKVECGYRLDLIVNDCVIVEIKAVQAIEPVHRAQLISYLKLAEKPIGLLINFHVPSLRSGIQRIVYDT
jgi:GxxExxY protein